MQEKKQRRTQLPIQSTLSLSFMLFDLTLWSLTWFASEFLVREEQILILPSKTRKYGHTCNSMQDAKSDFSYFPSFLPLESIDQWNSESGRRAQRKWAWFRCALRILRFQFAAPEREAVPLDDPWEADGSPSRDPVGSDPDLGHALVEVPAPRYRREPHHFYSIYKWVHPKFGRSSFSRLSTITQIRAILDFPNPQDDLFSSNSFWN